MKPPFLTLIRKQDFNSVSEWYRNVYFYSVNMDKSTNNYMSDSGFIKLLTWEFDVSMLIIQQYDTKRKNANIE